MHTREIRAGYHTIESSKVVAANIVAVLSGKVAKGEYAGPEGAILALGPENATGSMGASTLPQFLVVRMKAKGLFFAKLQKQFMGRTIAK